MIQLDFFETNQNILLWEELRKVRQSSENVRKGVFKRIHELEKIVNEWKQVRIKRDEEFERMMKDIREMQEAG